jgi:SSS family solute:Na+ symporter
VTFLTSHVPWLGFAVVVAYLLALVSLGLGFAREQNSTEQYFLARRALPPGAIAMSVFAALFGATFASGPALLPGQALFPAMIWTFAIAMASGWLVPFYRQATGMSAYEYVGQRFGAGARTYAWAAFTAGAMAAMALALYSVARTVSGATGWSMDRVIVAAGGVALIYTLRGGFEAVVWTGVMQGWLLWGVLIAAVGFLVAPAPARALQSITRAKWATETWTPLVYGTWWLVWTFVADQGMVQRYLGAGTERAAARGVLTGTALWAVADALLVLTGAVKWTAHAPALVQEFGIAALVGCAVCAVAGGLNAVSLSTVEDMVRPWRPEWTDARRLFAGRTVVAVAGLGCLGLALQMARGKIFTTSGLMAVSAVAGGGLAGLLMLAILSGSASRGGIWVGLAASLAAGLWADGTNRGQAALTTMVIAGYLASLAMPGSATSKAMTLWQWRRFRGRRVLE